MHMARYSQSAHFTQALMAGTQRMIENRRTDRTLKEVFDEYFYPAIDHSPEKLQPEIDHFYPGETRDNGGGSHAAG